MSKEKNTTELSAYATELKSFQERPLKLIPKMILPSMC